MRLPVQVVVDEGGRGSQTALIEDKRRRSKKIEKPRLPVQVVVDEGGRGRQTALIEDKIRKKRKRMEETEADRRRRSKKKLAS